MKILAIFSKKSIIIISTMLILLAGGLVIGLPSIYGWGGRRGAGTASSNVDIPLVNNHYPKTARITKIYVKAPGTECYQDHCNKWKNIKIVKNLTFSPDGTFGDDAVEVYSNTTGYCCCSRSGHDYGAGREIGFNKNSNRYDFSVAKDCVRVTLDVSSAPTGNYTIKCYYEVPSGAGNGAWGKELTYSYPP